MDQAPDITEEELLARIRAKKQSIADKKAARERAERNAPRGRSQQTSQGSESARQTRGERRRQEREARENARREARNRYTPEEEEAARQEAENIPEEERRETAKGLYNLGFRVENRKNKFFAKVFNYASKQFGDDKDTVNRFCAQMRDTFVRDAERAEKKAQDLAEGKGNWAMKLQNKGLLVGNTLKYGRIIFDIATHVSGASISNPFRYAMMGGMLATRVSEAAKETRLSNEELISQTRFGADKDMAFYDAQTGQFDRDKQMSDEIARAQEEAFRVYQSAGGVVDANGIIDGSAAKPSTLALKSAYQIEIPKNLKKRLENPKNRSGVAQDIVEWLILKRINSLNNKIEAIEQNNNFTPEEKKLKTEQLVNGLRWGKALRDYDRMITSCGTVDELALIARTAQKISKGVVLAMQIETLGKLVISVPKMWSMATDFLSSSETQEAVTNNVSLGVQQEEINSPLPSESPKVQPETTEEGIRNAVREAENQAGINPTPEQVPAAPDTSPEAQATEDAIPPPIEQTPATAPEDSIPPLSIEEMARITSGGQSEFTPEPVTPEPPPLPSREGFITTYAHDENNKIISEMPPGDIPHETSVEEIRRALEEKYDAPVSNAKETSGFGVSQPGSVNITEQIHAVDRSILAPSRGPLMPGRGGRAWGGVDSRLMGSGRPSYAQYFPQNTNHSETYIDISPRENLIISTHPELAKNPFNLSGKQLVETYYTNYRNIEKMFPGNTIRAWETLKNLKVENILKDKGNPETLRNSPYGRLFFYLQNIREVSGIKPRGGGLFSRAETTQHYIERALQKVAALNRLNEIVRK